MTATAAILAFPGKATFEKLVRSRDAAAGKLTEANEDLSAYCVAYSRTHGFGVNLTPEQVARDLAYRDEMEGDAS